MIILEKLPSKNVFVNESAYNVMIEFALENKNREILGVFFGIIDDLSNIIVKHAITFRVGNRTEVHFEDEDYVKLVPIIQEMDSNGFKWLGWFHSHPFNLGDHLYMSKTDVLHQFPAQNQNPFWTAIIVNPYQINDPLTINGARAFRLKRKKNRMKLIKKPLTLNLQIIE